jgi:hypothetical protein
VVDILMMIVMRDKQVEIIFNKIIMEQMKVVDFKEVLLVIVVDLVIEEVVS